MWWVLHLFWELCFSGCHYQNSVSDIDFFPFSLSGMCVSELLAQVAKEEQCNIKGKHDETHRRTHTRTSWTRNRRIPGPPPTNIIFLFLYSPSPSEWERRKKNYLLRFFPIHLPFVGEKHTLVLSLLGHHRLRWDFLPYFFWRSV